ncbi:MAG: CxxxxCH/CxxCH domain-containing protein [Nitrospiraceae bacterium]|nr:CxxxxCH/CxxCH domain-containing protein [Nitrospiraceae bacterium]
MRRVIAKKGRRKLGTARIGLVLALLACLLIVGLVQTGTASATGAITTCSGCHGNPPVDSATRDWTTGQFPGSHNTHAGAWYTDTDPRYGFTCDVCHVSPNWTTLNHRDGLIQTRVPLNGLWGTYSKGASFAQVNTVSAGTCSGTYCHSNGTGGTLNAGDPRPVAASTSPLWGTTITGCTACHGNETGNPGNGAPWYTSTWSGGTVKANDHQAHASAAVCYKCHYGTTTTGTTITSIGNHADRNYDLVPGPGISFTYAYATDGGTCTTISCHGNGNMKWGTGTADCTTCHAASFTKTLGGGGTIRQVVGAGGDFNMTTIGNGAGSRHLYGATTITKWDCMVCHLEGDATTGKADPINHNDGSGATGGRVNVRNVDNWTTGWAIDNRAWTTTDYMNLDNFCLGCHDADGASQIAVNNTNNGLLTGATASSTIRPYKTGGLWTTPSAALTPFNTTDWATVGATNGLLGGTWQTSAGARARIVDIKSKLYAGNGGSQGIGGAAPTWSTGGAYNGNPSQHAVIGRRFSTIWTSWLATAWNSNMLKKTGVNVNVSRDTSLMSCADCHILDAGNGAHGGVNKYNMWGSSNFQVVCNKCHSSVQYMQNATSGSRMPHGNQLDNSGEITGSYMAYGITNSQNCFLCHAGWNAVSTVAANASYGNIHGTGWQTSASWSSVGPSRTAYRFFPGTWMNPNPASDTAWGSGNGVFTCYFQGVKFSNCGNHTAGGTCTGGGTYRYGRPGKY